MVRLLFNYSSISLRSGVLGSPGEYVEIPATVGIENIISLPRWEQDFGEIIGAGVRKPVSQLIVIKGVIEACENSQKVVFTTDKFRVYNS